MKKMKTRHLKQFCLFISTLLQIASLITRTYATENKDGDHETFAQILDTINDLTTNNLGNMCQDNYKSLKLPISSQKFGFSAIESKVSLSANVIEDVQGQQNKRLIHALIKNLINSQQNLAQVHFLNYSPWTLISAKPTHKGLNSLSNSTHSFDDHSHPPWFFKRLTDYHVLEEKFMNMSSSSKGWWTYPYFSCEDQRWLLSYVAIIRSEPNANAQLLQSQSEMSSVLIGEVDISNLDVNQCDMQEKGKEDTHQIQNFAGTHKCHKETSKCEFISGRGWVKGSYNCVCKKGYYGNPDQSFFNGSIIEMAWLERLEQGSSTYDELYSCKECSQGCDSCTSDAPCLAKYQWTFRYILLSISLLCFFLTFVLATLVYSFRKMRVFKLASPSFLCITLTGCAIMYLEMVAIFPYLDMYFCIATKWTRHLGFLITYSALLMKTWRVSLTYRVKSAHKLKLTDKQLLQWMLPILLVMVTYLSAWTISDPPQGVFIDDPDGLKFKQCSYGWWDHSLAFGEFFFLLWGIRVCYNVRKARTQFDEAKLIRWSIYNIAIVNIIMVAIHLIIFPHAGPDMKYLLGFLRTQLGTSVTIVLVFGPKFLRVMRGTADELDERLRTNNVAMLDGPIDREEDMEDAERGENKDLEQENEELKEEIQKLASHIEHMKIVGMLTDNRHIRAKKDGYFTKENLLKQLDHFHPHFTLSPNQQNGGNSVANKTDQFRRSHSVKTGPPSSQDEARHKWSARTMPKSVAALTPKGKKHKCKLHHSNEGQTGQAEPEQAQNQAAQEVPAIVEVKVIETECVTIQTEPEEKSSEEQQLLIQSEPDPNDPNAYSLADNINWFLSDNLANEDEKSAFKQPNQKVTIEEPKLEELKIDSSTELLHPCCNKKKSRKKKKLSFRKDCDEIIDSTSADRKLASHKVHGETQTSPGDFGVSFSEVKRSVQDPEPEIETKTTNHSKHCGATKNQVKTKSKPTCKHVENSKVNKDPKLNSRIDPDVQDTDKSQGSNHEAEEDSLIGSHFIPDHVKSLIPERV